MRMRLGMFSLFRAEWELENNDLGGGNSEDQVRVGIRKNDLGGQNSEDQVT
jgi:hypothetical protein